MNFSSNIPLILGLLLDNLTDSRFASAWQGALAACREHGVNLRCFCVGSIQNEQLMSENQHRSLCNLITDQELHGLITFQWWHDRAWFNRLAERFAPLPVVNIMRHFPGHPGVRGDNQQGTRDQLDHLIDHHGYRKIAYFLGPADSLSSQERYQAYREALQRKNAFDATLVVPEMRPFGAGAVRALLDDRHLRPGQDFEAIVAFNDETAFGAIDELQRRGIDVPYDIAVVGFDNQRDADFHSVPLTTVAIPWLELGWQAVEMALEWLRTGQSPGHQFVRPEFIVRRSCGCHEPEIHHLAEGLSGPDTPAEAEHSPPVTTQLVSRLAPYAAHFQALSPHWAEQLVEAFLADVGHQPPPPHASHFLRTFEQQLQHLARLRGSIDIGHDVLSALSQSIHVHGSEAGRRADILCQQGRIIVHKMARRRQQRSHTDAGRRAAILRDIGQRLITTFDVGDLMQVLTDELPRLGILRCYLSLYDHPEDGADPPPATSRLLLGYTEHGRVSPQAEGQRFPASRLLPSARLEWPGEQNFVVAALFFGQRQLGVAAFGNGPQDGDLYHILRAEISSALQGALLVQEVRDRDAALIREKYVIDGFMANVPDRIYFKDRDGRLLRVNAAYAARVGCHHPADIIGKTDFDFFPRDEAQRIAEREQAIIASGQPLINDETQIVNRDGSPSGWALVTKMPLRDEHGRIIGIFGISRDITALKQVERELIQYREHLEELVNERTAQLRQINERLHQSIAERATVERHLRSSEQQYRMLAEHVQDGIMIVQRQKVAFTNEVLSAMLGLPVDALTGRPPADVFQWNVDEVLSVGIRQVRLMTPDARELWAEIEQTAIVWNGEDALLLTVRDVTSRKRKEQQLEEERARLRQENITLRSNIKERFRFGPLVGKSLAMQQLYEVLISSASSDVNVLIVGESGTGKELIARTIHRVSARRDQAFVPVNCASIPETLFEREFFGHRRGAFTGADRDKAGFFDRAHRGVLFLDEVTELTPGTQAKLLRVLQDGEYTPLGSNAAQQADVLIVAATNKDPQEEILRGHLRQDFFYRICVIELKVPPLRDRKDDLPLLIEHVLERYHQKQVALHGDAREPPLDMTHLPGEFVQRLYAYHWPGNIRELQNILQRYLATRDATSALSLLPASRDRALPAAAARGQERRPLTDTVQAFEKAVIAEALARHRYRVEPAAEELKVNLRTLYRKIKLYGLVD